MSHLSTASHSARWLLAGTFVVAMVLAAYSFATGGYVSRLAGHKASEALGRQFSIDGGIHIDWDWTTPFVHLKDVKLANLPQSKDPNMVSIDDVSFHIKIWRLLLGELNLPDITFEKPTIILEKFTPTTANWDFPVLSGANAVASTALPSKRSNFPILGNIIIHQGQLSYHDMTKQLSVTLGLDTAQGGGGEQGDFVFSGNGKLQNKTFVIKAQGGSLGMLRKEKISYPLNLHLKMGDTVVDVNGTFADPVQMKGVDTQLVLEGTNLADLYYLTAIPLPPTPHYKLSGHLTKDGDVWTFNDLKGLVGGSDLQGELIYDTSNERGFVKADLRSKRLDMKDLSGFVGATSKPGPGEPVSSQQAEQLKQQEASDRVLPDVPVDLSRLRTTDMDVRFKAGQILAPGLPINDMDVRLYLKDGILTLDPLSFGIASGDLSGSLVLNGQKDIPQVESDLTLSRLSLKKFFEGSSFASLTSGTFGGHFKLKGEGKSVSSILADSNGAVSMVMSGGTISQLIVDAAGLDIGHAAPILIGRDKATPIRCIVGDFKVDDGMLNSKIFVIDTGISNIVGEAHVNLKDETINAKIKADPKNPSITAHAGITVSGRLKKPSVGLDAQETAERGAAAAAISVFLTPLAAIIPFIEMGVGKDSDCQGLINQARASTGKAQPVTP